MKLEDQCCALGPLPGYTGYEFMFTPNVLLKSALHVTQWVEGEEFLSGALGELVPTPHLDWS